MKKQLSLLLAAGMTAGLLAGCGGATSSTATASAATSTASEATGETTSEATDITMWTYPIGQFGDADTVNSMIAKFQETHPEINVTVEYLDYTNGDDQVTAAIEAGTTPDIVMEGPERLVSNWGAKGKMLDLSDLWTEEATADISAVSESVVSACKGADGKYYEYPLCMTTHTMAINKEMFEEVGALQYINEDGTWTTENFEKALQALKDNGVDTTMIVYCGGQGGDQGTRALVNNLYSGQFTTADHTAYRTHAIDGVDCTCGAKGCWERYASTTALVRAARAMDPELTDGRAIFAAARAGRCDVLALLDRWMDEIAQGLAGMVHIFNPQRILVGGGVSAQKELLIQPLERTVKAAVMPAFAEELTVTAAALQNDAGLVGAVYYLLHH